MTTINGETRACCGIGTAGITTEAGNSIEVEALVVSEKPLGFDLKPSKLQCHLAEYRVPDRISDAYEWELHAWIEDVWLIPYREHKLGPH